MICQNAHKLSGLACERRVAVSVDLSLDEWPNALEAAGFDPERPSLFLLEGLLMYLPDAGSVTGLIFCGRTAESVRLLYPLLCASGIRSV